MSIFTTLQQKLGFTRNELRAVLFLSSTFLIGLGIRWFQAGQQFLAPQAEAIDYAQADSAFISRSRKLGALAAAQQDNKHRDVALKKINPASHSINLNTATKEQLLQLPGIGEGFADRIILYRDENGPFTTVDELINVKGIGSKKMDKLRPYVTVK